MQQDLAKYPGDLDLSAKTEVSCLDDIDQLTEVAVSQVCKKLTLQGLSTSIGENRERW